MSVVSMKQLLEAGVHFGHQTRRWNPKMAPYIFTERNQIHIIDLQQTVPMIDNAYNAVYDIVSQGGTILFVGTKKQAQDAIAEEATRCGMFYVDQRWLGGMLTNFSTVKTRIARLKEIERMRENGTFDLLPKKERICVKEAESLGITLIGIADSNADPDELDYVIPGNDDAIRAIRLITSTIADAVIEAKQGTVTAEAEPKAEDKEETEE